MLATWCGRWTRSMAATICSRRWGSSRRSSEPREPLAGQADVARVAIAGEPGAAEPAGHDRRGARADERIDDELAGRARGQDQLLDQRLRLLGRVRRLLGHAVA